MCISACALARARAWVCMGVSGGGGGLFLCACVYVCVHGHYLEGLTVGGERERVKFVSIVMWPVTKALPVRDQC